MAQFVEAIPHFLLRIFARGELRTSIRTHDFPPAFAQDLSLLLLVSGPVLSLKWLDALK